MLDFAVFFAKQNVVISIVLRRFPDITPRMLTNRLRELESDGLVERTVYAEVSRKVEHSLSARGRFRQFWPL